MKNIKIDRYIVVKFEFEGYHKWSECDIPDVSFLKYKHRHIFHVTVQKKVNHNERDIEIIMLKREMINYIGKQPVDLGDSSCETIAEMLINKFNLDSCVVLEDGENGAHLVNIR